VIWLLLLLVLTNLVAIGVAFGLWRLCSHADAEATPEIAELLATVARQRAAMGGARRIISVEILNPIELAGTRGRVIGIAGSLAPGLTRRVVYDQAMKTLRRQLAEQRVVADVRLHTLRPQRPEPPAVTQQDSGYVDVVETAQQPDLAEPEIPPND
jgi:hypothetical protein